MFAVYETPLAGCLVIKGGVFEDKRGLFSKTYYRDAFAEAGLATEYVEHYFTVSSPWVIRGMHFQVPPNEHYKIVNCVHGEIEDVVLDIRRGSPTFGLATSTLLSPASGRIVYVPPGMAHGFCALAADAVVTYHVTSAHVPKDDMGVKWDSFGFEWSICNPVVSDRDNRFPPLAEFVSPFKYESIA